MRNRKTRLRVREKLDEHCRTIYTARTSRQKVYRLIDTVECVVPGAKANICAPSDWLSRLGRVVTKTSSLPRMLTSRRQRERHTQRCKYVRSIKRLLASRSLSLPDASGYVWPVMSSHGEGESSGHVKLGPESTCFPVPSASCTTSSTSTTTQLNPSNPPRRRSTSPLSTSLAAST